MSPHPSSFKSKGGIERVGKALRYSMQGLRAALHFEAAFRQELALAILLVPCAFWVGQSFLQVATLLGTLLFVLIVELINSAIECLADAVSLDPNPLLGRAKDLGSAAVLLSFMLAGLTWVGMIINRWHPLF